MRVGTSCRVPPVRGPGALQQCYEHPWSPKAHALAKLFLPGVIRNFLDDDGVPLGHDLMRESPMQAFAMGREFALAGGLAPPGGEVTLAVFPLQSLLAMSLNPSLVIIVARVVGAELPVHLPLEPADGLGIGGEFSTEDLQRWSALAWNQRNGRGAQIESNSILAYDMFGLVIRDPFEGQLHRVALTLGIRPLGTRTARQAHDQPGIFDAMGQSVGHDRILPVDECRQPVALPEQIARVALFRRLEHKTQAGIGALVLDTGDPSAFARSRAPDVPGPGRLG